MRQNKVESILNLKLFLFSSKRSIFESMRIDKFLWCVRLFKTRAQASKACSSKSVLLLKEKAKPGKIVVAGNLISIKQNPIWREFEILDIPKSRVGPKLVSLFLNETTSSEKLALLKEIQIHNQSNRQVGLKGRPSKRDRRELDKISNQLNKNE